jgi:hypothetical protein
VKRSNVGSQIACTLAGQSYEYGRILDMFPQVNFCTHTHTSQVAGGYQVPVGSTILRVKNISKQLFQLVQDNIHMFIINIQQIHEITR